MHENTNHFSELFFKSAKGKNISCHEEAKGPVGFSDKYGPFLDLNPLAKRYSLIGHNHPLQIAAKFSVETLDIRHIEDKIKNTFLTEHNISIQLCKRIEPNPSIIGPWTSDIEVSKKDEVQTTGIFGIGENWKQEFSFFLEADYQQVIVHNFLPVDFIITKEITQKQNFTPTTEELIYTNSVINYFSKGPFYRPQGRFDQINSLLKKYFIGPQFEVKNLCVITDLIKDGPNNSLMETGVSSYSTTKKTIFSFPTALLEAHIEKAHQIILEYMQRDDL